MGNAFDSAFAAYSCNGDTISATIDGFDVIARLEWCDSSHEAPDKADCGFWPSLDPKSDGYIGPKSKRTLARHMAHAREVLEAWRTDEWWRVGVVLSVSRNGIELEDHAAALWGIECNYPTRGRRNPNAYLTEAANDLLPEALETGRRLLASLCECEAV